MSLFQTDSIFSLIKIIRIFLGNPELTITDENTAETRVGNILNFAVFCTVTLFFGIFGTFIEEELFETGSAIADYGLNKVYALSFFAFILIKMKFFYDRYKFWDIIVMLHKSDLLVSTQEHQ
jgi:hypothetical protein